MPKGTPPSLLRPAYDDGPLLPVEPFRQWLQGLKVQHGGSDNVGQLVGLSGRRVRAILTGHNGREPIHQVSLAVVDHALTHEGNTQLWELYGDDELGQAA